MSALAATEVTGRRSGTEPEPIRAAFHGRKNRTDTDALHLLGRQYQVCEQTFRGRVVMTRCFYDLPSPVDVATPQAAGLPRQEGGWNDLAVSLATSDPGYDLIVCDKAERFSRDPLSPWSAEAGPCKLRSFAAASSRPTSSPSDERCEWWQGKANAATTSPDDWLLTSRLN